MSQGFLTSVDTTTGGLGEVGQRNEEIMRTELSATSAVTSGGGLYLDVALTNDGQVKLADFDKWDVIVQYYDDGGSYYVIWLPYTEGTLADNEWEVTGIYLGGSSEAFEPNILNPGEEIRIRARLAPVVGKKTINQVVISTPNGIPTLMSFEGK